MSTKPVLHQILAVEKDLNTKGDRIIAEGIKTFKEKTSHFDGRIKTYSSLEDKGEQIPPEKQEIVTTVKQKLDYVWGPLVDSIDISLTKEATNASGTTLTPLIVGSTNLGEFNAIEFLSLETKLKGLRSFYMNIPTLDPTHAWAEDPQADRAGIYKTEPETSMRSTQVATPIVLAEATPQHKAQVELVKVSVQQGSFSTILSSGRVTPAMKSEYLSKIDDLIKGVKMARAQANQVPVIERKVGALLKAFIHG
jgi:hypothetical protein